MWKHVVVVYGHFAQGNRSDSFRSVRVGGRKDGGSPSSVDGLVSLCIICKASPFEKLVSTITADLVAVSHVSGSHQLGRIMHEV